MNDLHPSPPPPKRAVRDRPDTAGRRQANALRKLVYIFALLSVIVLGGTAYTYIIDRQGKIVARFVNSYDWMRPEVDRFIERLLRE